MADDKIMEALARIEHKVDIALHLAAASSQFKTNLKAVADQTHTCPLCKQTVNYQIDINDSVVVRKCGCGTGKIPLDLKSFAPPVPQMRKDNGRDDEQEDRNDSDRGYSRPNRK